MDNLNLSRLFGIHSFSFIQVVEFAFSVVAEKLHSEFRELMIEQFLWKHG